MRFNNVIYFFICVFPTTLLADCVSPWQTQFSCNIIDSKERVEFCRLADPEQHPGKKEGYYKFTGGLASSEVYFQTNSFTFSTKDTNIDHPTDLTMAIGYANGKRIYSFTVTEIQTQLGMVSNGDVRIYASENDFTSDEKDTEIEKFYCEPSSITVDMSSVVP